jgi:hypothetical protein
MATAPDASETPADEPAEPAPPTEAEKVG